MPAAHGDVGGLTACHVEVGTANFAWRFSQKGSELFHPGTQNKYLMQITITEDKNIKYNPKKYFGMQPLEPMILQRFLVLELLDMCDIYLVFFSAVALQLHDGCIVLNSGN